MASGSAPRTNGASANGTPAPTGSRNEVRDAATGNGSSPSSAHNARYKWIALSNITLGTLMVFINQSIVLIALPAIFRGIHLNPLTPANTGYMLWMLMGFMVVLAVLVVTLGRVGDMFGRVKMYNLGFAVFTVFSILLSVTWLTGPAGAIWLIAMRIGQGVGGAMLFANSSAIITDAFPADQRGLGLGINNVAAIAGSFIGLVLGGLLAPIQWHMVFLVSVPFGIMGTIWAYLKLEDRGVRTPAHIDWWGNVTFAAGLILILVGITYGLLPYGHHTMGWTSPWVLAEIFTGLALLLAFCVIETRVANPMFRLTLFRIRAFSAGNVASFLASLSRGGLMFMLIIWLQGIWLPLHGYSFSRTPLWAGIYMVPLTVGFLVAGPLSGHLADRFGARPFATGGLLLVAVTFFLLQMLPVNFSYLIFGLLIFLNSVGMGLFIAPNQTGIMNSLPASRARGGSRHGRHLQLIGPGVVDRDLLHPHDPGPLGHPARHPLSRPCGPGGPGGHRRPGLPPPRRGLAVRGVPRLQPSGHPARPARPAPHDTGAGELHHRTLVFPEPDRRTLRPGIEEGLRLRGGRVPARRRGLAAEGRQVPLHRTR